MHFVHSSSQFDKIIAGKNKKIWITIDKIKFIEKSYKYNSLLNSSTIGPSKKYTVTFIKIMYLYMEASEPKWVNPNDI